MYYLLLHNILLHKSSNLNNNPLLSLNVCGSEIQTWLSLWLRRSRWLSLLQSLACEVSTSELIHMDIGRIQFLMGCWTEGLSSLLG